MLNGNGTTKEETKMEQTSNPRRLPVLDRWPEDPPLPDYQGHSSGDCLRDSLLVRVWNNWTYSYMNVVLNKGAKQNKKRQQNNKKKKLRSEGGGGDGDEDCTASCENDDIDNLTSDDLYVVPRAMEASWLTEQMEKFYHPTSEGEESSNPAAASMTPSPSPSAPPPPPTYRQQRRQLLKALWTIAAPTYIPAGVCELLVVICGTTLPLLVRQLLSVLEENPSQNIIREGLPWALSIAFVSLANGFGNHRHRHLALKTGVALRAAVINAIYKHVLQLSPQGKAGLTSGEVTNLVAVDAQKVYEVTQEGHLIWALPLSIILVTYFLYRTLGPSILVGIAVLIGFLPLINIVTSKMMKVRMKRIKYSDMRVEVVSNMLQGIKVTKLNNYEQSYEDRITDIRTNELKYLKKEMAIWATTLLMTVSSPVLATGACFATYVLLDPGNNILTAADTFGVLLLFGALRFPINFAGRLIGKAAQALSAIRRIAVFLERPLRSEEFDEQQKIEYDESTPTNNRAHIDDDGVPLVLERAKFRIGGDGGTGKADDNNEETTEDPRKDVSTHSSVSMDLSSRGENTSFTVSEFTLSVPKRHVLAIVGPVGSGKSTFLEGILDEAEALGETHVVKRGKFSYAPQNPFIQNQSLRDNILFGLPYDEDHYSKVLDACALHPDIEQLGGTDMVQIGERGVTLSGGQRQRVSLARAAYAKSSCVILDDPFSALDSGTGKLVFERLIAAPDALLKDSALILVTHQSHFISHRAVNNILLIVQGRNRFYGSWDDLSHFKSSDMLTQRAVDHINSQVRENTEERESEDKEGGGKKKAMEDGKIDNELDLKNKTKIMQKETREHGLSSLKTWLLWFQRAGGWWFVGIMFILLVVDRGAYIATELFLAQWTQGAYEPVNILGVEFAAQTDGLSAQARYLTVYALIILVSIVATAFRSEFAVTGGTRATKNVFFTMLKSVLRAPMSYFETVPMGRILNRFTYDTDVNDVNLTQVISMFIISISWYVAGICIQCSILPWSALALFPVSLMYWFLMLHYRMSGPDLQRIDALSRSPLQSMVSEALEGSTSIRIFQQDFNFTHRFQETANTNSSALLNFVSAQRWLGVRMEILGSIVVLVSSVLVVTLNETLNLEAGLAGLLILWSSNFTITLNFLVDTFSETEAAITAIERVDAMADLPSEKPFETTKENEPPKDWPKEGALEFDDVCLRYRDGLPLALDKLSFKIPAGKTCGIVGRTGAGKSSITVALFRLVEVESGRMLLDGIDLASLGLSDVRGRGMSIIPQDPFLAGATLRECLDPFHQHTDAQIMDALGSVRLGSSSVGADVLLSTKLEEGGSNYSVGERQLLNLARALLSQPKLLVLDEATASIDGETDAFIQKMLRSRFPETTLVTIAHRLNTIMDYDYVLVMDKGRAAEFDSPANLLSIEDGVFSELVNSTGVESAKALRELAMNSVSSSDQSTT